MIITGMFVWRSAVASAASRGLSDALRSVLDLRSNFCAISDVKFCLKFSRLILKSFFAWSFSVLSSLPFLSVSDQAKAPLFSMMLQGVTIHD